MELAYTLLVPIAVAFIFFMGIILLYRTLLMTDNPFPAMQALYVYLAALIGLIIISLGLYNLINGFLGVLLADEYFYLGALATPLTQLIVGSFIMVPHWAIGHHMHLHTIKKPSKTNK